MAEKIDEAIKNLEYLIKHSRSIRRQAIKDCLALLAIAKAEKLWDGYMETAGTMDGGMSIEWILEYQGNHRLKFVKLQYESEDEVQIITNTDSEVSRKIVKYINSFIELKKKASEKIRERKEKEQLDAMREIYNPHSPAQPESKNSLEPEPPA